MDHREFAVAVAVAVAADVVLLAVLDVVTVRRELPAAALACNRAVCTGLCVDSCHMVQVQVQVQVQELA